MDTSFEQLPLDARGHCFNIRGKDTVQVYTGSSGIRSVMDAHLFRCTFCDFYPSFDLTDTAMAREACPHPNGIATVTQVTFSSGQIIVSDSLRPVYDWDQHEDDFASYNSSLGQHQAITHMASIGCAFGYVGNTCPSLYRTGNDTYAIACAPWSEDDDEEIVPDGWTDLASICTDLWAYSIADFTDWSVKILRWVDQGENSTEMVKRHRQFTDRLGNSTVVDIEPGTYRFTCHSAEKSFDSDANGAIFATFERISD